MPTLLPATDRAKSISFETNLDKKKAFGKASIWAAKTLTNSNETIKLRDESTGVIIFKGNIPCNTLKLGNGFGTDQKVEMTVEILVEDKKVEIKVSDLIGTSYGSYDSASRPSTKAEFDSAFGECVQPMVDSIKKDLI